MTRYIRGVLALVVGAVLFSSSSLLVLFLSVVSFGLARPLLVHAPMWAGQLIVAVVYRGILDMRIIVERKMHYRRASQMLVMANHPTNLLLMPFAAYVELLTGLPPVFVGKREHVWNPLVGWTLLASGLGILIDRKDRAGALGTLCRLIAWVIKRGCSLMILADQSRPTPEFIADDQKKFAATVRDVGDFVYTGVPRDGGVFTCYDAMHNPRVIDITSECSVPTARWRDVFGMVGATYFIIAEDVTRFVPRDPAKRREWLQKRWRRKNSRISYVRSVSQR